ncbi:MAG: purine-nucleoside phosphorylase, partial [Bdellovibrionales bacterium]|nr:purine-nucleoside phosphorylase [Bdellovibrionales bacterium]
LLKGRIHYYEGHSLEQVTFATRLVKFLGVQTLILTNAAGGVNAKFLPGTLMILRDHINLTGENPLRGPNLLELGPRFPDMTEPYDKELSDRLVEICKEQKIQHTEGVYCGVQGPSYETAAEIRFLQTIGGDAVGMSTVPEALVARHMGLRLVGISCITNLATGLSQTKVTHEEVKEVAARVEKDFSHLLRRFIASI